MIQTTVHCLFLFAISQCLFADESISCCGSAFRRDELLKTARDADRTLPADVLKVLIFPSGKSTVFPLGSSSHPAPEFCLDTTAKVMRSSDQAVLVRTALGSTLHIWRSSTRAYERIVLRGRDVFQVRIADSNIVSVSTQAGFTTIRIVQKELAPLEASRKLAIQFMELLKIEKASVVLGTVPYNWEFSCIQLGLPALWETPLDEPTVRGNLVPPSIWCRVDTRDAANADGQCVMLNVPAKRSP